MKSRALITMAVASTFGWSASTFAGSSHEVMTPFSVSESGQNIVSQQHRFGAGSTSTAVSSDSIGQDTGHELNLSDSSDWSASFDQMAEADVGDLYLVSWTPATMDTWDYYVLDTGSSDELALSEESYIFVPADYIALIADDGYGMTQENQVDMVLSQSPVFDTAEAG
jgi:hypothetical protein